MIISHLFYNFYEYARITEFFMRFIKLREKSINFDENKANFHSREVS